MVVPGSESGCVVPSKKGCCKLVDKQGRQLGEKVGKVADRSWEKEVLKCPKASENHIQTNRISLQIHQSSSQEKDVTVCFPFLQ